MIFDWFSWIPNVWNGLGSCFIAKQVFDFLPDDLVVEILACLPTDQAIRAALVCKRWRSLIMDNHFFYLQQQRAPCITFLHNFDPFYCRVCWFFLDDKGQGRLKRLNLRPDQSHIILGPSLLLFGGSGGLVAFRTHHESKEFLIMNPITGRGNYFEAPVKGGNLCGVFLNPPMNQLRLLYLQKEGELSHYLICEGSRPWRKICTLIYRPAFPVTPVVVSGYVCWLVDNKGHNQSKFQACKVPIMVFHMETEEFKIKPPISHTCHSLCSLVHIQILQMDGKLTQCHRYATHVDIWILEDFESWSWLKRYEVILAWNLKRYPFFLDFFNYDVKLVNIQSDELILFWSYRGLFSYHLKRKTVRKIEVQGLELSRISMSDVF